jgi:hypothetical protein
MNRCILPLLLSLGCASADGTYPNPLPSPEAQQEPSDVESCSQDTAFVSWESDGLVHVSRREGRTAVIQHYAETPPFVDVFGGQPIRVDSDLTVCLLSP